MKKLILLFLFLIIATSLVVIFNTFPDKWWPLTAQWPRDEHPDLYVVPQEHTIDPPPLTGSPVQTFREHGLTFAVPWTDTPTRRTAPQENAVRLVFQNDKAITIIHTTFLSLLDVFTGRDLGSATYVQQVFGKDSLNSNYDLYRLILESSPDQVTLRTPREEADARSILVGLKRSILLGPAMNGIYSFTTDSIRGFQIGTPEKDAAVFLYIFNSDDERVIITISGTQQEVDYILASF